jgi:N utilization substance protein A
VLSNGRRCPNASLPNSRYCGIESHQALADIDSDNVADLASEGGSGGAAPAEAEPETAAVESAATADELETVEAPTPEIEQEPAPVAAEEQPVAESSEDAAGEQTT